jgi:hypothetical protein
VAGKPAGSPRSDSTRPEVAGLPALKPGAPAWEPTAEKLLTIEALAARGVGEREVSVLIGVSRPALRDNAAAMAALERGRAIGIQTITGSLFKAAQNGSLGHAKLSLQQVAGWRERLDLNHTSTTLEALVNASLNPPAASAALPGSNPDEPAEQ